MKNFHISTYLIVLLLISAGAGSSSCSRKVGCPAYETVHVKSNRKGDLPTKRGNSNLFSKDMRKKMK